MLALLAGMWSGLTRLGFALPVPRPTFALAHGPLMVAAFLGTLIGLERAVALGRGWAYLAPILTAIGTLTILVGLPHHVPPLFMAAGSIVLLAASLVVWVQQSALFTLTMALGALALVIANSLWLTLAPMAATVSWWMAFLVLTIAAERLELSRVLPRRPSSNRLFVAATSLFAVGLVMGGLATRSGAMLTGLGLLGIAAWLARYDVARRTIRMHGLTRYTAACLLSGYVWLAVAAGLMVVLGPVVVGPHYDAVLHAVFLGFVFAMIFGHAPIIFPAVLGIAVPFRSSFYAHLAVLHASLLVRVAGDLGAGWWLRQCGTVLNVAAILLFLACTVASVIAGVRASNSSLPVPKPSV